MLINVSTLFQMGDITSGFSKLTDDNDLLYFEMHYRILKKNE